MSDNHSKPVLSDSRKRELSQHNKLDNNGAYHTQAYPMQSPTNYNFIKSGQKQQLLPHQSSAGVQLQAGASQTLTLEVHGSNNQYQKHHQMKNATASASITNDAYNTQHHNPSSSNQSNSILPHHNKALTVVESLGTTQENLNTVKAFSSPYQIINSAGTSSPQMIVKAYLNQSSKDTTVRKDQEMIVEQNMVEESDPILVMAQLQPKEIVTLVNKVNNNSLVNIDFPVIDDKDVVRNLSNNGNVSPSSKSDRQSKLFSNSQTAMKQFS